MTFETPNFKKSPEEHQGHENKKNEYELDSSEKRKKDELENQIDEIERKISKLIKGEKVNLPYPKEDKEDVELEFSEEETKEIVKKLQNLRINKRESIQRLQRGEGVYASAKKLGEQEATTTNALELGINDILNEIIESRKSTSQESSEEKEKNKKDLQSTETTTQYEENKQKQGDEFEEITEEE